MSWLSGCRRLHRRYERKPEHFLAFTAIGTALICHRRLTNAMTAYSWSPLLAGSGGCGPPPSLMSCSQVRPS
ncbi:hypothetical protein QF034_000195 [Streptomyces africanus]|uniref:Transposase n=1 Tax=Streptomyces africanus TaxID=231024 RepID=A0ABU0QHB4_9ACTN|nr:hypothetical protein [Streptomyces africanus]